MILKDKKAIILGVANNKSIAYGIAKAFHEQGARLAFSYVGDAIKKRVEPISEELGGEFTFPLDVCNDEQLASAVETVKGHTNTQPSQGCMRMAPSSLMTSPLIMGFSASDVTR